MRAPLLESPPQPCRPVWAGRHGTADGEEKRGGFHQPSAQAAISREVPLIRETLAMQRSTRSDACSSEADKRGLEIRAGPAMQSYAICQLPAARLPRARTKPRAHRIDCACGKRCASTEWERTGEERPARGTDCGVVQCLALVRRAEPSRGGVGPAHCWCRSACLFGTFRQPVSWFRRKH
jgi:hypothetical protein